MVSFQKDFVASKLANDEQAGHFAKIFEAFARHGTSQISMTQNISIVLFCN